ncbi:UPF0187 chloroplastic [Chlorella sorokiniana]|uniref:UPF0187 chloroplastic n=1 Tax=Chlorella sorokiniana TaxID=3076 RepID=A0A2P6TPT9_CHLSO|nr:UPF0187 chloroplastic [Chlorella sorokiniana]|eukprot:PRW56029.1 UPF0187 chloroplastic [Chlorella sorokiniana]
MRSASQRVFSSVKRQAAEAASRADAAIKYKERFWTSEDWEYHVTFRRYLPEPAVLFQVGIYLSPLVLWTAFVAACVGLYATFAEPAGAPRITGHSSQLLVPATTVSFALSLLLVFKTNSSYARWWECNCLWGSVFAKKADFVRLATSYMGRTHPQLMPPLISWTIAFMPAMAVQLRKQDHFIWNHLGDVLSRSELEWLASCPNPTGAVLQVLSRLLDQAQLDSVQRWNLEEQICGMNAVAGKCIEYVILPLPIAYHRFTHRFLLIFLTYLALPFWDLLGWWSTLVLGTVTFLLAGIENVGCHIENPHMAMPINSYIQLLVKVIQGLPAISEQAAAIAAKAAGAGGPAAAALGGSGEVDLEAGGAGSARKLVS